MSHPLSQPPGPRSLERAQWAVRTTVCRKCYRRPAGSERLGAEVPRACEAGCELFAALPCLVRVAQCLDPTVGHLDRAVAMRVRDLCRGDARRGGPTAPCRSCPLSRYRREVTQVLRPLVAG